MSHEPRLPGVVDLPILVIDNSAPCGSRHIWPVDFAWGDTCNCGAYYLLRNARGEIQVEQTPPAEREED